MNSFCWQTSLIVHDKRNVHVIIHQNKRDWLVGMCLSYPTINEKKTSVFVVNLRVHQCLVWWTYLIWDMDMRHHKLEYTIPDEDALICRCLSPIAHHTLVCCVCNGEDVRWVFTLFGHAVSIRCLKVKYIAQC